MHGLARRAADRRLTNARPASAERSSVVVLERQLEQAKVLPPRGLLLAAMPLEQLRHEPARLLLLVALGGVDGHAVEQLPPSRAAFPRRLRRLARWPRPSCSSGRGSSSPLARSAAARSSSSQSRSARGRHAVVAVVALDDRDVLGELALGRRSRVEAELELRLGAAGCGRRSAARGPRASRSPTRARAGSPSRCADPARARGRRTARDP